MTIALQFYGDSISGNCYKLKLAAAELGLEYIWHETDILAGDTQAASFLRLNPNGKVPLAILPDGLVLAESNAILSFLADGTSLAGSGRYARACILQWLFFEQYSHEPYIATSRFIVKYLNNPPERQSDLAEKKSGGYKALAVMERQLDSQRFITNDEYSIADIALYAYTHVAGEGGFELDQYPRVREWLQRIEERPRFVPMRS